MGRIIETVLYYNPENGSQGRYVTLMKGVLVRMGVRIKNISREQVLENVGFLAGIPGFEAREGASGEEIPEIPEQVLVMKNFSGRRIDKLLLGLRKAGVPKISLKAVITEQNAGWSFYHLYEELKSEHEAMNEREEDVK